MRNRTMRIAVIVAAAITLFAIFRIARSKKSSIGSTKTGSAEISALISQAQDYKNNSQFTKAQDLYTQLIDTHSDSLDIINWQEELESLNLEMLFSGRIIPGSIHYAVEKGDSLYKIAKKHNTTVELIKKSNNLTSNRIYAGQRLKVWTLPFNILVDKSQNVLLLKTKDTVFKTYNVATGEDNSTPVGIFKIKDKLVNPVWYNEGKAILPEDPANILGTRWLGFDKAPRYGIHGTSQPGSIGKQATKGCVRMHNREVEQLFTIVPEGTEVTIID
ncbi:MAG: L,D-transpeptidase family protein [Candidatus Gygaella obscura]|nr:L,D-transpeptidase family protein [Candidatus Gygaella obscura]